MTAAISSTLPSPAAASPAVAALANASNTSANAAGATDVSAAGGTGVSAADTESAGGLFAALLRKQMSQSSGGDKAGTDSAELAVALADDTTEPEESPGLDAELAALLPFLEAAGLTTKTVPTTEHGTEGTGEPLPDAGQTAGLSAETAQPQAAIALPTGGEPLVPTAIAGPVVSTSAAATPAPTDLPPPAQVAALLPTTAGGAAKSSPTSTTTTGAAIIADGARADSLLDKPGGGDGKVDGQSGFAAQLAAAQGAAQGAASPIGVRSADKDALAVADGLAPGQAQGQGNPSGSAATAFSQANAHAVQHTTSSTTLPVATPVGASGWSQEVGDKVVWMASRMESRADLVLTPPDMGRIEVSLTVNGDQASATFTSANPVVRESLESAMPRLREALADAGIQLGQTQVGAENAGQWAQQEKNGDNFAARRGTENELMPLSASVGNSSVSDGTQRGRGLVDVFA